MNEFLLLASIPLIFGAVLLAYRLFGKIGLFAINVIATILANIEVLILVDAFGLEQTLGNVMFAASFLITDILSENESKKAATQAVYLGIFTQIAMLVLSQYWLLYQPAGSDWAMPSIRAIFSTTPRLMLASLVGYAVSQRLDVWLYHAWWDFTSRRFGDSAHFLWLRNNGSTLISQIINTVLFNVLAFAGWYSAGSLVSIIASSYLIFIFTSLADTPVVYLARWMKKKGMIPES